MLVSQHNAVNGFFRFRDSLYFSFSSI